MEHKGAGSVHLSYKLKGGTACGKSAEQTFRLGRGRATFSAHDVTCAECLTRIRKHKQGKK